MHVSLNKPFPHFTKAKGGTLDVPSFARLKDLALTHMTASEQRSEKACTKASTILLLSILPHIYSFQITKKGKKPYYEKVVASPVSEYQNLSVDWSWRRPRLSFKDI